MAEDSNGLCLKLFGGFGVTVGGKRILDLHRRGADRVLAYLALQYPRVVPSSGLASTFWPGASDPEDNLRHSLVALRRALGTEAGRIRTVRREGVALDLDGAWADVVEFDRCIKRGDVESQQRAIDLHEGILLDGWTERWLEGARTRRARECADALRSLAAEEMEQGHFRAASALLRRLVVMHPADQSAWRDLMAALWQANDAASALQIYERYAVYLGRKGGAPPADMRWLHDQMAEAESAMAGQNGSARRRLEAPGGAVPLDSPFYITRHADARLADALRRGDSIVLIKGPRQIGKSSLLARGLHAARLSGARVVVSDLELLQQGDLASTDALCRRLATTLADQANATVEPASQWRDALSPGMNLARYLARHVLTPESPRVVWGLDEVDRLFPCDCCQDFFSLVRWWHEQRSFDPSGAWNRLTVVMACATEAHLFIKDLSQSPFNVGSRVALSDFELADVEELNKRHGGPLRTDADVARLWRFTGGHPYLTRRTLYEVVASATDLADIVAGAARDVGPLAEHLRRLARLVCDDPALAASVRKALQGKAREVGVESFLRLRSAGVLRGETVEQLAFRCEAYETFLRSHLEC